MTRLQPGRQIEERSRSQIGVAFRLHGRSVDAGLDCVGLAAYALFGEAGLLALPGDYALRGSHNGLLFSELTTRGLHPLPQTGDIKIGDLLVFRPSPRQLHLGISAADGFVHAHAGLRKITFTPNPWPWPLMGCWRVIGE